MIAVLVLIVLLDVKNRHDLAGVDVAHASSPQCLQSCLNICNLHGSLQNSPHSGISRALQAHVVLCVLPKIHRDGEHWAAAEARQVQDHTPLKPQWLKLPPKDWMHLKSHLCPKNMHILWIYTKDLFESQFIPRFAHLFALVALGAAAFVAVQQRIHSQVSLVCSWAWGIHRVPCTSSTLKCAGFFLKCSHLSWDAWVEPPTYQHLIPRPRAWESFVS